MTRSPRAFSLVEILCCFALAGIVIANVWMIYGASHRHRISADVKLQGVQKSLIFVERFELDARRIFVDYQHHIVIDAPPRAAIEFTMFSTPQRMERVAYVFDPAANVVYRSVEGGSAERLPGHYEQIIFRLIDLPAYPTLPPYTTELPDFPTSGGRIEYLVTALPEHLVTMAPTARRPQDRTVLWGAIPVPTWRGRWKYQFWVPNPITD